MTTAGAILGHDYATSVPAIRKLSAFAGPTWRLHDTALAQTGKLATEPAANTGFFQGKVLKLVIKADEKGLESMFIEQDDFVGVVVHVKERTLIAALKKKGDFAGETDDLAKMVQGLDLKEGDATGGTAKKDGNATDPKGGKEGTTTDGAVEEDGGNPGETGSVKGVEPEEVSKGNGKEPAKDDSKGYKPSKIRILELRAEAIAEALAEGELKDFYMPKDFH